jgi:hypothetical protein
MFKPHVTVACVVHAQGKFLVVEETINGKALWNQPAGHLEANETLAAGRRTRAVGRDRHSRTPQHFIRCISGLPPIARRFCASCSPSNLAKRAPLNRTMRYRSLPVAQCRGDPERAKPALAAGCRKHSLLSAGPAPPLRSLRI